MSDDSLHCENCGHVLADRLTADGRCPVCDAPAAPRLGHAADGGAVAEPLRVKRGVTVDGASRKCPSCDMTLPLDQPVCPRCGLDEGTGQFVQEVEGRRRRRRQNLLWAVAVAAALAAAYGGWRALRRPAGTPPAEPAAPEPAAVSAEEDLVRRLAAELRADLDARHPLFQPGDALAVELVSGRWLRGRFEGLSAGGGVRVEVRGGIYEVPVTDVLPPWRLRIDPAFREREVQARARKQAEL